MGSFEATWVRATISYSVIQSLPGMDLIISVPMIVVITTIHDFLLLIIMGKQKSIMQRIGLGTIDDFTKSVNSMIEGLDRVGEEVKLEEPVDVAVIPDNVEVRGIINTSARKFDEERYLEKRNQVVRNYKRKLDHEPEDYANERLLSIKYYDSDKNQVSLDQFYVIPEPIKKKRVNPETFVGILLDGLYPYEIDSTDKKHLVSSILERLVGTKLMPETDFLRIFVARVSNLYDRLFDEYQDKTLSDRTFKDYLRSRDNFTKQKKLDYTKSYISSRDNPKKWDMQYTGFLKTSEVHFSDKLSKVCGSKARMVIQANRSTWGYGPYVTSLVSEWIFPKIPQIMIGKNSEDI